MKKHHQNIRILFIPVDVWTTLTPWNDIELTGTSLGTGKFQPADVGIQHILKHIVRTACHEFLAKFAKNQALSGNALDAQMVSLPTDISTLRNASAGWIVDAFKYFKENPRAVCQVSVIFFVLLEAC